MNLILFTEEELRTGVPLGDRRARHILEVLRPAAGETIDIGIIDGPTGKARVRPTAGNVLALDVALGELPPPLHPLTLLVGLSRPQTMRRILRDCTSLGVARLHFCATDKGERGYAESSLWTSGEYRSNLIEGAQQAFSTHLPEVTLFPSLDTALAAGGPEPGVRVALDNYEAATSLRGTLAGSDSRKVAGVTIAVGSERGWSAAERDILRARAFILVGVGSRVLRTDVACISAVAIVLSQLGLLE